MLFTERLEALRLSDLILIQSVSPMKSPGVVMVYLIQVTVNNVTQTTHLIQDGEMVVVIILVNLLLLLLLQYVVLSLEIRILL